MLLSPLTTPRVFCLRCPIWFLLRVPDELSAFLFCRRGSCLAADVVYYVKESAGRPSPMIRVFPSGRDFCCAARFPSSSPLIILGVEEPPFRQPICLGFSRGAPLVAGVVLSEIPEVLGHAFLISTIAHSFVRMWYRCSRVMLRPWHFDPLFRRCSTTLPFNGFTPLFFMFLHLSNPLWCRIANFVSRCITFTPPIGHPFTLLLALCLGPFFIRP